MNRYAAPTADSTFKLLFGEEKHKTLTMDFLNDFLERTGDRKIEEIVFMNQEQTPRRLGDRKSILDISCKDKAGNRFIIEIQRKREHFFDWRALYYASSLLSRQLTETDPYSQLKPVIIIGIANFILYKQSQESISHHMICDMSTGKQSINLIELHFIELAKFNKQLDELITQVDKWIYFIKNAQKFDTIPKIYNDSASIKKAFHLLELTKWTPAQINVYEKEVFEMQRDITQEAFEAQEVEEKIKKSKEEGKEEVALKMLKKGKPFSEIAEFTDLSIEHIEQLSSKK